MDFGIETADEFFHLCIKPKLQTVEHVTFLSLEDARIIQGRCSPTSSGYKLMNEVITAILIKDRHLTISSNRLEVDTLQQIIEDFGRPINKETEIINPDEEYNQIQPDHYKAGGSDVIAFTQYHELGFDAGNVVKYVTRAGKKPNVPELVDLRKAEEYLRRLIEAAEARAQ